MGYSSYHPNDGYDRSVLYINDDSSTKNEGICSKDEGMYSKNEGIYTKMREYILKMRERILKVREYILKIREYILKMREYILKMREYILKMREYILKMLNIWLRIALSHRLQQCMVRISTSKCLCDDNKDAYSESFYEKSNLLSVRNTCAAPLS